MKTQFLISVQSRNDGKEQLWSGEGPLRLASPAQLILDGDGHEIFFRSLDGARGEGVALSELSGPRTLFSDGSLTISLSPLRTIPRSAAVDHFTYAGETGTTGWAGISVSVGSSIGGALALLLAATSGLESGLHLGGPTANEAPQAPEVARVEVREVPELKKYFEQRAKLAPSVQPMADASEALVLAPRRNEIGSTVPTGKNGKKSGRAKAATLAKGNHSAPQVVSRSAQVLQQKNKFLKNLIGGLGLPSEAGAPESGAKQGASKVVAAPGRQGDQRRDVYVASVTSAADALTRLTSGFQPSSAAVNSLEDRSASSNDGKGREGGSAPSYRRGIGALARVQGQGKSLVKVNAEPSAVMGELSREEVDSIIQSRLGEVRRCYDAAEAESLSYQGRILVHFRIRSTGGTSAVSIDSSNNIGSTLRDCLTTKVASWQFPKPKKGGEVEVTYPFVFMTVEGET